MKLSIDRELDWFRNLAGGFSVFSGYDGYEIAQVELERGTKDDKDGLPLTFKTLRRQSGTPIPFIKESRQSYRDF